MVAKDVLKCVFCSYTRETGEVMAQTVMNGQAVCWDHAEYTQGGEFSVILAQIQRSERSSASPENSSSRP